MCYSIKCVALAVVCCSLLACKTACLKEAAPPDNRTIIVELSEASYRAGTTLIFNLKDGHTTNHRVVPWYGAYPRPFALDAGEETELLYRLYDDDTAAVLVQNDGQSVIRIRRGGRYIGPPLLTAGEAIDGLVKAITLDKQSGIYSLDQERWVLKPDAFLGVSYPDNGRVIGWHKDGSWGVYDFAGNQIGATLNIPLDMSAQRPTFTDDHIAIVVPSKRKRHIYILDQDASVVAQIEGYRVGRFFHGLARASEFYDGKYGYINTSGEWVIAPQYKAAGDFREGLAPVSLRSTLVTAYDGTISSTIDWPKPSRRDDTPEGIKKRWGYLNTQGEMAIPATYDEAKYFSEGLAAVRIDTLWGYIDKTGNWVIEPRYSYASPFSNDHAIVHEVQGSIRRHILIDTRGVEIAEYRNKDE